MATRTPAPAPTPHFDPAQPTWEDLRRELRCMSGPAVRFLGVEFHYRAPGLGGPDAALAARYAPRVIYTWRGFGGAEGADGSRTALYVLLVLPSEMSLMNGHPCDELLGTMANAGRYLLAGAASDEDRAASWLRRVIREDEDTAEFVVVGKTNADLPTSIEVREVPDLLRASVLLLNRLEAEAGSSPSPLRGRPRARPTDEQWSAYRLRLVAGHPTLEWIAASLGKLSRTTGAGDRAWASKAIRRCEEWIRSGGLVPATSKAPPPPATQVTDPARLALGKRKDTRRGRGMFHEDSGS